MQKKIKFVPLLMALFLLASLLAGCGTVEEQQPVVEQVCEANTASEEFLLQYEAINDTMLVDTDAYKLSVLSAYQNENMDNGFLVEVENRTDRDIMLVMTDMFCNRYAVNCNGSICVPANTTIRDAFSPMIGAFAADTVGKTIDELQFNVYAFTQDNNECLAKNEVVMTPTGETFKEKTYVAPADAEVLTVEDGSGLVVTESGVVNDSLGRHIYIHIENNTPYDILVCADGASAGGVAIPVYYGEVIPSGRKSMTEISVYQEDVVSAGVLPDSDVTVHFTAKNMSTVEGEILWEGDASAPANGMYTRVTSRQTG